MKTTKETVKGYVNNAVGKVKEATGEVKNDPELKLKGKLQQIKGKAQVATSELKGSIKKALK